MRLETQWRRASWALFDKSLPVLYGLGFMLLVVRTLPAAELGLQGLASTVLLTAAQLLRYLLLVPLTKFVAEGRDASRVAATGALLYVLACGGVATALGVGRVLFAALFGKPALAAVLVPTAALLAAGSIRDAAIATLEGQRRLRVLFFQDLTYYAAALAGLAVWRWTSAPRTAEVVQWVLAAAAALGSLVGLASNWNMLAAPPSQKQAARIGRFGRYSFGSGLGDTIRLQADALLAGALMDARGFASYHVARLFFRVFNVLAQAIAQVLMPIVSRLQVHGRARDLRILYEKSVCFLYLALIPVLVVLLLLAPQIYALFYGDRYRESVPVFRILVLSALTLPFASVGSPFLVGLGKMRSLLWITWVGMIVGVALAVVWIPRYGPSGAAMAVLVAAVVGMVARTWVLQRVLDFALLDVAARTRDAVAFLRRRLGFS
ncbi:MAG: lipopolysaccharide biosynthesis protein [Candidatus Krumholzibacteriia bacterium]